MECSYTTEQVCTVFAAQMQADRKNSDKKLIHAAETLLAQAQFVH